MTFFYTTAIFRFGLGPLPFGIEEIMFRFSVFPGIAVIIAMILFVKLYDLKSEKVTMIQEQLKELQL